MKKIFTLMLCSILFVSSFGQWKRTTMQGEKIRNTKDVTYYSVDLNLLKSKLANAQETGSNASAVEISLPTLEGTIERFAVYSFPVVVKELADQYQLGSYVGVGIDDPSKYLRFSLAPNDFQSMIIKNGVYEFIEPQNTDKTVYGVHPKTHNTEGQGFLCSMNENILSKKEIANLYEKGRSFTNNPTNFLKSSDKKYRTMRLAMSVNGEYTTYFGGVAGALTAINATLTRCNGVFEKDFALHLNLQNFPALIYTDATTDPYTTLSNWNQQLQTTLTNVVTNANYDIGHMFGKSGGGGNAGCIGCVCVSPTATVPLGKGSGITSPANGIPQGDSFDIDYVAHEIGHQLGANHTFSMNLEGSGVNMEPGSGSTIMGYAGITGPTSDVQQNSDPYFHIASIVQVQNNLLLKTCDIETSLTNNPPVITPLPTYSIPKGTAFVLTASATDPEGNPMTYCWEEFDDAKTTIDNSNLGSTSTGGSFRSLNPTSSPTRYFPKQANVLAGNLTSLTDWESVSLVARESNFAVTVRDNNPTTTQQQTAYAIQKINVGTEGPFKVTSTTAYNNAAGAVTWDVANTNLPPYNVSNVKIDYTTNNGTTWTVISNSTANDGAEPFNFSGLALNSALKIRVTSIGNVFYAIGNATVATMAPCSTAAPTNVVVTGITTSQANVSWTAVIGSTYSLRYRIVGTSAWVSVNPTTNSYLLTGLTEGAQYEVQVANICSGTLGTYTASSNFTILAVSYCPATSQDSSEEYISNVTITPTTGNVMSSTTGASDYTDYSGDATKLITLKQGTTGNTISVTKAWQGPTYSEGVTAWIDFNRNGVFETSEIVLSLAPSSTTPVSATFAVPANAYSGTQILKMRVVMSYQDQPTDACAGTAYGEVEDYAVKITQTLGVSEANAISGLVIYPNPAFDVINITKVTNRALYTIHNAVGQLVSKGNIVNGQVRISELIKGNYIITISDKNINESIKFIKK